MENPVIGTWMDNAVIDIQKEAAANRERGFGGPGSYPDSTISKLHS